MHFPYSLFPFFSFAHAQPHFQRLPFSFSNRHRALQTEMRQNYCDTAKPSSLAHHFPLRTGAHRGHYAAMPAKSILTNCSPQDNRHYAYHHIRVTRVILDRNRPENHLASCNWDRLANNHTICHRLTYLEQPVLQFFMIRTIITCYLRPLSCVSFSERFPIKERRLPAVCHAARGRVCVEPPRQHGRKPPYTPWPRPSKPWISTSTPPITLPSSRRRGGQSIW